MGYPVPATALERPIEGFGSFSGCLLRIGISIRIGWAVPRVAMMRYFLSNQSLSVIRRVRQDKASRSFTRTY